MSSIIEALETGKAKVQEDHEKLLWEIKELNERLSILENDLVRFDDIIAYAKNQNNEPIAKDVQKITTDFVETEEKPFPAEECKSTTRTGVYYCKKEDTITLRKKRDSVTTTWDYLNNYFHSLPDKFGIDDIGGLNRKKQGIVFDFYEGHANFPCFPQNSSTQGNPRILIKDQISANVTTAPMQRVIDVE